MCCFENEVNEETWNNCNNLTLESSIELSGLSQNIPKDEYEIQVKDLKILQIADDYPIAKKNMVQSFFLINAIYI